MRLFSYLSSINQIRRVHGGKEAGRCALQFPQAWARKTKSASICHDKAEPARREGGGEHGTTRCSRCSPGNSQEMPNESLRAQRLSKNKAPPTRPRYSLKTNRIDEISILVGQLQKEDTSASGRERKDVMEKLQMWQNAGGHSACPDLDGPISSDL